MDIIISVACHIPLYGFRYGFAKEIMTKYQVRTLCESMYFEVVSFPRNINYTTVTRGTILKTGLA